MQQRAGVGEGRRIELQLRIAGPPSIVPGPGGRAVGDDVPETIELARVIVEGRRRDAQGRRAEDEPEGEQDEQREQRGAARLTCHGG